MVLYGLYIWYFWLSAAQIRHGYPEIRRSNFIMNRYDDGISGDLLFVWTMIPFLFEIKVLLDWTFSKTSLDIFQWFKLTCVHNDLYMYRCGNFAYIDRKTGTPISKCEKGLCGGMCLTFMFILLIAPLYAFSGLGNTLNPISSAEVETYLEIKNEDGMFSKLPLFRTANAMMIQELNEKDDWEIL